MLVHLNHRLVQMSLRLLRAEVWSVKGRKRLNRITARVVPNHVLKHLPWSPTPGWWSSAATATGCTKRSSRRAGCSRKAASPASTSASWTSCWPLRRTTKPPSRCRSTCSNCGTSSPRRLAQSLEARMKDRTSGLQKKLGERADKEAEDIEAILLELKKAIDTELDDPEYAATDAVR